MPSTKTTAVRKTAKKDETTSAPTPAPVPVAAAAPAPKAATKVAATKPAATKAASAKTPALKVDVKAEPAPAPEVEAEDAHAEGEEKKQRRKRPPVRSYEEIFPELEESLNVSYKSLQAARKLVSQLNASHKKSVSSSKTHQSVNRTPTILFDQVLVDYFLARLDPADLVVSRRNGTEKVDVSLAGLSTSTRLHRTDVTKLFSTVFKKHNMLDTEDRRFIRYQDDGDLVNLLTTGDIDAKYQEDVDAILAGTHRLSIFNIQRVISQHLDKVAVEETAEATESETTEQ